MSNHVLKLAGVFFLSLGHFLGAEDLEIKVPGLKDTVLVSLPENHDPSKRWPTVFSYHGFNGRPETRMTRNHTGDQDWIVVGMAYAQPGKFKVDAEGLAQELKVFRHVRDDLAKNQGLDVNRMYAAGFSKGGWMTDSLLQVEPAFAGGAILMGGHVATSLKNPPVISKGSEVFIGVGRMDPNYLFSLKALMHYRGKGLRTSFEAWPDLGHDFPKNGSVGLREWFALQNGMKPNEGELAMELEKTLKLEPAEAWNTLVDLRERPNCNTDGSKWPDKISGELKKLEKSPKVAREAKVRSLHRQLLAREVKMRSLDELRKINAGYLQLREEGLKTSRAKVIDHDHQRIMSVLKNTKVVPSTQKRPAAIMPDLPTNERGIPRNPLIR